MDSLYCQGEEIAGEKKANSTEIPLLEVVFVMVPSPALAVVVVAVLLNLLINVLVSL